MRASIQIREEEHFETILGYAASAGFHEISISFGSCPILADEELERDTDRIGNLLAGYGISCTQIHLPCYHLLVDAYKKEETIEKAMCQYLQAGAALGAAWGAFHPRSVLSAGFDRTKSLHANREDLLVYLEYAEKYNIGIAVENMPLYPYSNPERRCFGGGFEELCALCDSIDSDKIGICWDYGHAHTAALDQCAALRAVGDRLKITHVHDNYRSGDHHQLPLLGSDPGWRPINWEPVMKTTAAIGYSGPMTLEILYPPVPMLESFIRCAYDSVKHLITLGKSE